MVAVLNIEVDTVGKTCLENYRRVRDRVMSVLSPQNVVYEYNPNLMDQNLLELRKTLLACTSHSPEIILTEVLSFSIY
jgi:hypothetical protein